MNKKGNIYFAVIIALIIWISGIMIMPFMVDGVDDFRTEMNCSDSSISDGAKLTCLSGDTLIPYFIWTLISLALGFLLGGGQGK
ncbi:MAG: hypothetical protein ACOC56_00490 [Atribacterota bacterium]